MIAYLGQVSILQNNADATDVYFTYAIAGGII